MSSLFGTMSIALQSLLAQQAAMGVVANNIANTNTPGYSREIPNLVETTPVFIGNNVVGTGVTMQSVQSVRDNILNLRVQQETQQQERLNSHLQSMNQVEALFNETQGGGLQTAISSFFNSFQALSTDPTNSSMRQAVISAGQNLADSFNQTSQGLTTVQTGLDQSVGQTIGQINQLSGEIASLNGQIQAISISGQNAGGLQDMRDQALQSLSGLVDTAVIFSPDGTVSVTTSNGALLVAGVQSQDLSLKLNNISGEHDIYSQGSDVTSSISGGTLKGILDARDGDIPATISKLDTLAAGIMDAVNTQQQAGTDLRSVPGQPFFVPFVPASPGSTVGAAHVMAVALTDPAQIAASSDGTIGDNSNATALAGLQSQSIVSGQTASDYYSNLIFQMGNTISNTSAEQEAVNLVLQQLTNQKSSISGVSLNEEASNLIQYQRAYEAAARVISIIDSLTSVTVNMLSGT